MTNRHFNKVPSQLIEMNIKESFGELLKCGT